MNINKNKLSHIIFIFITLASLTIVISCSSEEKIGSSQILVHLCI